MMFLKRLWCKLTAHDLDHDVEKLKAVSDNFFYEEKVKCKCCMEKFKVSYTIFDEPLGKRASFRIVKEFDL